MRMFVLVCALTLAGCGNHTPTAPNSLETVPTSLHATTTLSATAPSSVSAQPATLFFCPMTSPFTATVRVVVAAGNSNVFVTSITSRFVDRNGVQLPPVTLPAVPMPPVTLSAPVPTAQIGSALVAARSSVIFPVNVSFGCGTSRFGTIFMTVQTVDVNGVGSSSSLRVSVN